MTIQPSFDKILVRIKLLRPSSTLVIPNHSAPPQSQLPCCEVLAIGPDCKVTKPGDYAIVLPGNLIGFPDPNGDPDPSKAVMLTSETNILGFYVDSPANY